jgi:hypothetical protein
MNNSINILINRLNKKFIILFFILLTICSLISIAHALRIANTSTLGGGIDFQFSPSVLFVDKINPYEYFLEGNKENIIMYAQWPSYAHLTYILFSPFTFLDWDNARLFWSIINLFFSFFCVIILSKQKKISSSQTLLVCLIFLCSTPFRNCIGTGNQTFLILFIFLSFFIGNWKTKNFCLGISFIKYTFSPVLIFFIYLKDSFKGLFLSSLSCIFGWLIFSYYLDQNIFETLMQPLDVAFEGFHQGSARSDIFTIIGYFNYFSHFIYFDLARTLIVIYFSILISKDILKINGNFNHLNLILISSLFLFPHLMYDFIVLLPAFINSISKIRFLSAKLSLLIILYFWIGIRFIDYVLYFFKNGDLILSPVSNISQFQVVINFLLLLILYYQNKKLVLQN